MSTVKTDFSSRSRDTALRRFREETFDLLIIGGGITGAAVARDAVSRGLKVALVECSDFASGTSSRSSKLIHGGLRYLENFELGLVFEALAERTFLLRTVPSMVRPLPFIWPVYKSDPHGYGFLNIGLWLYDLLALFRAPGFHQRISKANLLQQMPYLRDEGLVGGFKYYDASMWDDALTVLTLRAAHHEGAAIANYVEAVGPQWTGEQITGFRVRDLEKPIGEGEIDLRAHQVVVCAGPWTDQVGMTLSRQWRKWLSPSKGVHLVFDLKRIQVPGAMVIGDAGDSRIAFVIPRPDFGTGVVIVGTTDGPVSHDPEKNRPEDAAVELEDVNYLLGLLNRYLPKLNLTAADIISAYVGVRPLVKPGGGAEGPLQKVSREHHIEEGPGGSIIVAGGKYTTHRRMAQEIIDFAMSARKRAYAEGKCPQLPQALTASRTRLPLNPNATTDAMTACKIEASRRRIEVPPELLNRYGAEALEILEVADERARASVEQVRDPEGFPFLRAQLQYTMRTEMVMHLEDFFFRRVPLYLARSDHGLPWIESLAQVWAEERGLSKEQADAEVKRLRAEIERRSAWQKTI